MEHAPTWLINSFIYLSAAVIAVPLSKAVGLGSIIGYLAAGIAIGPWGLGLVTNVEDILHFAEFGVVLMLFLVGLELEPKRLWSLRRPIFGWGSAQVLGCALVLAAVGLLAGVGWKTSLVAGLGLALSSTAIALQVMGERNLMPTRSGQASFSILLFQDVAAIPILALLPILGAASMPDEGVAQVDPAWEALKIVAVIASIVLGGRLLVRPLLRWIAKSNTPEIFTAAALLLVVGIAALMQLVGLSMALGAFLAGVLLSGRASRWPATIWPTSTTRPTPGNGCRSNRPLPATASPIRWVPGRRWWLFGRSATESSTGRSSPRVASAVLWKPSSAR
jgi:glutathione-regulated potassium-efflux system ancillary protein KefC